MTWMLMNIPLAVVFVALWVGVPLWLVLKHPDEDPKPATTPAATPAATPVATLAATPGGSGGLY
jgi:hypothetical protein